MYKLLSKLDKIIPLDTLLKMYLNKEINEHHTEVTKQLNQEITNIIKKELN